MFVNLCCAVLCSAFESVTDPRRFYQSHALVLFISYGCEM